MEQKQYSDTAYEELLAEISAGAPSFASVGAAAYKPGLERMQQMCALMGDPQRDFPSVHVAGTNGKGSTSNMLAAVLASRGMTVGLYTSPHILDFRERMRVVRAPGLSADGPVAEVELIPRRSVWDFMQKYGDDVRRLGLSYFEITTAMALRWFADMGVDAAVIETGLGGRLDATNVVMPVLSVITNIGYDHMDILGSTLAEIAGEKAGIIKPGVPVVVGERGEESDAVFEAVAERCGSQLYFAEDTACGGACEIGSRESGDGASGEGACGGDVRGNGACEVGAGKMMGCCCGGGIDPAELLPKMDLRGDYQTKNLTTVLCALGVLGIDTGDGTRYALENAARICDFHARWETVRENPRTICDIGHNAHGLRYNFAQLEAMVGASAVENEVVVGARVGDSVGTNGQNRGKGTAGCDDAPGRYTDLVMVYGSVADKDVDAVLRMLPSCAYIYFTAADNHRAMPAAELAARYEALRDAGVGDVAGCECDPATRVEAAPDCKCGAATSAPAARYEVVPRVADAVTAALDRCETLQRANRRPLLYIGGSTYVISEALPVVRR